MWADKRLKEPWLLNFLQNEGDVPKKKVQGLHILKKIYGPREDGSEVKFVTDGKLSIHGVFTEKAINDFYKSNHRNDEDLDEEVQKEWDKCLILVKKYSINHVLHESVFGCRFELIVESFSFWVSEEGFRLKEDPEYCMDVECLRKKSQKLWETWRQAQQLPDTTDMSVGGSEQLSQLLAELAKDSQASLQAESQQNLAGPSQGNNKANKLHSSDEGKALQKNQDSESDEGQEEFHQLSETMMDVCRFLINAKDMAILDNMKEWQLGYSVPLSYQPSGDKMNCNSELADKHNDINEKALVVSSQIFATQHDENNQKNNNMSVQVGESLLQNNIHPSTNMVVPFKTTEQSIQVGESLLAKGQDTSDEHKEEVVKEIIELPSDIIFHPVFLPDNSQLQDKAESSNVLQASTAMEGQDQNFVVSTQIPSNKVVPMPNFPISPVGISSSQNSNQQKTGVQVQVHSGVQVRSFVTQTASPIHGEQTSPNSALGQGVDIHNINLGECSHNKEKKATDAVVIKEDGNTEKTVYSSPDDKTSLFTSQEYKTCVESPQNETSNVNKEITCSQSDNDERTVLSGLAQKIPSSGASSSANIFHSQNISTIENNEHNRLDNLYKNTIENLEQRNNVANINKGSRHVSDNLLSKNDIQIKRENEETDSPTKIRSHSHDKALHENKENVRVTSDLEGVSDSSKMSNKICENISDDLTDSNSDETNTSSERNTRRSSKISTIEKSKRKSDTDDLWEPSPSKASEKQPKSQRKSAQKSRYSFSKNKSVVENIQGMLSSDKKTKHDSSVLFGAASGKSSRGKKKRLSTRKKLYSDNMLLLDVTSVSDTRSTLPSVSEEQEIVDECESVFIKQESESSDTATFCIEVGSLREVNETDTDHLDTINIKIEREVSEHSSSADNKVNLDESGSGHVDTNRHDMDICSPKKENIQHKYDICHDDVLQKQPVVVLSPLFTGQSLIGFHKNFTVNLSEYKSVSPGAAPQSDEQKLDEQLVIKGTQMVQKVNFDVVDDHRDNSIVTSEQTTCKSNAQTTDIINPINSTEPEIIVSRDISPVAMKLQHTESVSPEKSVISDVAVSPPCTSASDMNTPNVITVSTLSPVGSESQSGKIINERVNPITPTHLSPLHDENNQQTLKNMSIIHSGELNRLSPEPERNLSINGPSDDNCVTTKSNSKLKGEVRHIDENNELKEKSSTPFNLGEKIADKSSGTIGISLSEVKSPQNKDSTVYSDQLDSVRTQDCSQLHSEIPPTGEFSCDKSSGTEGISLSKVKSPQNKDSTVYSDQVDGVRTQDCSELHSEVPPTGELFCDKSSGTEGISLSEVKSLQHKDSTVYSDQVDSVRTQNCLEVHSELPPTGEFTKGYISSSNQQSSLQCAQRQHASLMESSHEISAFQQSADRISCEEETLGLEDDDPDAEILYKLQKMLDSEKETDDNYNLLHIELKNTTRNAVQAYFVDT